MDLLTADMQTCTSILRNLDACILGKHDEIERLLIAVLAGGHVLLEDVPGTGKTQLVKALAKTIGGQFRRIQCNPDLLPTDITGVSIYHPKQETFLFRPGPIMTNILLADEINRATTKTQSALLEAMEEGHVTVDGDTYELPDPFILLATQNPIEFEGTYSLPEAQLDRFMMKLSLGYPSEEDEHRMVVSAEGSHPSDNAAPVITIDQMLQLQRQAMEVHIDNAVGTYLISLIRSTREHSNVLLGASPRAAIALARAAKACAFVKQRQYVTPDDVKSLAPYVLAHRLILRTEARMNGQRVEDIIQSIIQSIKVPVRIER